MKTTAHLDWQLQLAVRALRSGGLVVHATEGVWGIACDPFCRDAVAALLTLKQRRPDKGLIVVGADPTDFAPELSLLSDAAAAEITATWPGPVTWLVRSERFPHWITGGRPKVAVRVPGHEQARRLCHMFGGPLVSTSANLAGRPAARNRFQAAAFASRESDVSYLLPGETQPGRSQPSQIRDLEGQVYR